MDPWIRGSAIGERRVNVGGLGHEGVVDVGGVWVYAAAIT